MIQIFLVDGQTDGWNDGPREPNSRKIKKECVAVMLNLVDMNSICPGALRKLIQLFEVKTTWLHIFIVILRLRSYQVF